jgi:hypothetical protein
MKNRIVTIFCFLLLALLTSCSLIEKKRRVFIVLLDYSASSSNSVLDEYIRIINDDIFASMGQNDCLIVMPVDDGSVQQPVKIIYEDMQDKIFVKKKDGFAHAQDSVQMRLDKYIQSSKPRITEVLKSERTIRKPFLNSTDILGALRQTKNLTETNSTEGFWKKSIDFFEGRSRYKSENVIIILSDMIQDTPECSFESRRALTHNQSDKYLKYLKQENKIPDFKDCKIFINGSTGKNAVQIDNIQWFWNEYFQLSNTEIGAYGYNVEDKLNKYLKDKDN